jgi:ABC-type bacteriocin/lantibiotic exporter with double-glycine peptidase domain
MTKKSKIWSIVLSILFAVIALWIMIFRNSNVAGNLEASFVSMVPAFVTSHVILHRKIDKALNSKEK